MTNSTKPAAPFEDSVELVFISHFHCQVGWKEPFYARNLGTLIYAESGSGVYSANGESYPVKAGECFWIPSDTKVALLPVERQPFHIQQFRFRIRDPILYQHMQNVFPPIKVDYTLESMLTYLMKNLNDRSPNNLWRIEAYSKTILSLFCFEMPPSELRESSFVTTDGYCPATKRLLLYLENHLYGSNSLEKISQALGYNEKYLSAIFAKETGYPIRDYINFHRTRVSVIIFFCWELEIGDACKWLCFNSDSHFNRIFKRFVGISPGRFRKACLALDEEERTVIAKGEPLLSYHIMPIDDLFAALRHFGQTMAEVLQSDQ